MTHLPSHSLRQTLAACIVVGVATGIGLLIRDWVASSDIIMVLLLGVMFVAYRMSRLPSLVAALLSVASFNFFFVEPYLTFSVYDLKYMLTFAVMAVLGVAISDLTARVKDQAETQLELETEKLRSAMLSSVSHDLRTPLSSIMGAASTLMEPAEKLTPAHRKRLAGAIFEESRRLNRLLENLLKMTRIEGGDLNLGSEWQVPSEIVGSALSHLEPELSAREIQVDWPSDNKMAKFDAPLVEQCLVNLLENALQYSPEGSPIEIGIEYHDAILEFSVADHGGGVDDEEREVIFEKFRQGRAGAERGSGLGLTICRAIVEAHHGSVWVENRDQGPGAVFIFRLPQDEAPPEVAVDEEMEPIYGSR